jgi:BirA family transcriptional regulator, biotin operon repressor / biotin---[acetyl-CoA-carboxylase] ligase
LGELLPFSPLQSGVKPGEGSLFGRAPADFRVHVFDCCESSLDKAWDMIREKRLEPGDSVLCSTQTRGRGRMGRNWVSKKGNIMAAWMIPGPEEGPGDSLLPLVMGLALKRAMLSLGLSLSIKWPNDLIYNDKKVGGILIEEKNHKLVAGIGLNTSYCPENDSDLEQGAASPGSLRDHFPEISPEHLWARLVYFAGLGYNNILCNFSLIDFIREINSNLWLINEIVTVRSHGTIIEGVLEGISDKGEIVVRHDGGLSCFVSASLRGA